MNGPNKLDCYITLGWKGPWTNTLAYWAHSYIDKHSNLLGPFACYQENEVL